MREGQYAAEVDVELIDAEVGGAPYLSLMVVPFPLGLNHQRWLSGGSRHDDPASRA